MDVIEKLLNSMNKIDPHQTAIIDTTDNQEQPVSFAEFLIRTRQIARLLETLSASGDRVAILLPRGTDAYAAEIAALYSGRLFCPIESTYPAARIEYCLTDLAPKILITDRTGLETTRKLGIKTILASEVDSEPSDTPQWNDSAYVIYTSGSTGRPKGVRVSRRSMNKFLNWSWRFYAVEPGDRWAQFSSLGFDLSLVDLLCCIPAGGTLVPCAKNRDRSLPARFIARHKISVWHSVPSVIPLLVQDFETEQNLLKSLRIASFCGEPLYPQQATRILQSAPSAKLLNTYGPTEGTFFCSVQTVDAKLVASIDNGSLPIGQTIPGWSFRFDSETNSPLHHLTVVSNYLSDGYISETADLMRFGVDSTGQRTYQTGDLVRRSGDQVFFVQRKDMQVKVRGNRIDLSEIEFHALQAGVQEAKAFMVDDRVFLAVDPGSTARTFLENQLRTNLPQQVLPADIVEVSPLPRNANGKIDTNALHQIVVAKWNLH